MRILCTALLLAAPLAANDIVFLHGQVTMADGSPPGKSVSILLRCRGADPVRQTNAGKNGKFFLKVERDDFNHVARALPATMTDVGNAGLSGNCAIVADLKGYESTSIDLSSFTIPKDLALPKLILKPQGGGGAPAGLELEVVTVKGRKFYSLPDEKGVVAAAQNTVDGDPKNPDLLLKLALAQISVWQDREATTTLERAIGLAPSKASLYTERGHRSLPLREFAKARADLEKAVSLDPKDMAAYYHLGLAHYFMGHFSPAADAFRQAVDTAPNTDERINSTNWLYAALRRAGRNDEAAKALELVPPDMTNKEPHTLHYLNLVRFFQGRMKESDALPPEPPAGNTDLETELRFDTVAYGIGNWHLYNGHPEKAQEYFRKVNKGHVWITWGFIGSELELAKK
jgi:tetratricopeptide (TPR) repeat protein